MTHFETRTSAKMYSSDSMRKLRAHERGERKPQDPV
jgi:hypothetical protein